MAYRFKRKEHENLLEMHAHRTWAVRTAKSPAAWCMRHARLMDSGVCLGAIARGRSSSTRINRSLRNTLPHVGPTQILVAGVRTRSEDNAGDDPTRGRSVRLAGPGDPWTTAAVHAAGSRFTQMLRASRELLSERTGCYALLPSQPSVPVVMPSKIQSPVPDGGAGSRVGNLTAEERLTSSELMPGGLISVNGALRHSSGVAGPCPVQPPVCPARPTPVVQTKLPLRRRPCISSRGLRRCQGPRLHGRDLGYCTWS